MESPRGQPVGLGWLTLTFLGLTDHRNESDRGEMLDIELSILFLCHDGKGLKEGGTPEGEDQTASCAELLDEWGRDVVHCGRNHNHIKRRLFRPAVIAIALPDADRVVTQALKPILGLLGQAWADLNREDLARQLGKDGGLITRTRPNLKDLLTPFDLCQLGHESHDVGL